MDLSNTQRSPSIFNLDTTICPRKRAENATTGERGLSQVWHPIRILLD